MQKKAIVFLVVATLIVSASIAVAVVPRGKTAGAGPNAGPGTCAMVGGKMGPQLALTQAQVAQMNELRANCMEATKGLREEIAAKAKEMAALWAVDEPNAAAIKSLAGQIDRLRAEVRDVCIDNCIQGRAVLTAEQKVKLKAFAQDRPGACICPGCQMGPGCGMCACMGGPAMGCGMGPGPRMGAGMAPNAGMGCGMAPRMGMGCGMRDGTGPRAQTGTCPLTK